MSRERDVHSSEDNTTRVSVKSISKVYPGVRALRGVDFDVRAGEVHALCGENGAGKSTLIGVLGGAVRPDSGTIEIDGQAVWFRDPADALVNGVAVIHQEFSLVGPFSVAENLALGDEPRRGPWIDRRAIRRQAAEQLASLGFPVDPSARVDRLTTGQKQLVEIAKALGRKARVLVLDEPTAALTRAEAARLFEILDDLRRQGLAIIYISHHLDEIARIADRITVLRDGQRVGTWRASELSLELLMAAMVGEVIDLRTSSPRHPDGPPILMVENAVGRTLRGVNLEIRSGEIVGLTGLAGAGHEELARVVFGADRLTSGTIRWLDRPFRPSHPRDAIINGIGSVPADRRREGLIPTMGVEANLTLAALPSLAWHGWINRVRRRRLSADSCLAFEIAHAGPRQRATTLSGGNQQKLLLARWAAVAPRLMILNDPTRGIDVRTREAIHRWVELKATEGWAFLLITADTHELLRLSDRLIVLRAGRVVRDLPAERADEQTLLAAMVEDPSPGTRPSGTATL